MSQHSDAEKTPDVATEAADTRRTYAPPRMVDVRTAAALERIAAATAKGAKWHYKPRTKPMQHHECGEQLVLAQWLDLTVGELGWMHTPNEGRRNWRTGHSLRAQGMRRGVPDVLIFALPSMGGDWRGVAIELKREDGVPSDVSEDQRQWLAHLEACGWLTKVCFGADQAIKWLQSLGYGGQAMTHDESDALWVMEAAKDQRT